MEIEDRLKDLEWRLRYHCDKCMLCGGTSTPAKNVCIPGHGSGKGAFG